MLVGRLKQKITEYKQHFANPYVAAAYGMVDDVIDPRETRAKVIEALGLLKNKQESRPIRKHLLLWRSVMRRIQR